MRMIIGRHTLTANSAHLRRSRSIMRRWVPWITGIIVTAGLIWSFAYLKDLNPLGSMGVNLNDNRMEGISIRFKNAKLVGRSDGKRVWTFEARSIDVSKDRRLATFNKVIRGCLMKDDKTIAVMSADKVIYNSYTRNVNVPCAAKLSLKDGPSFKIRKAFWNSDKSKLYCQGGVDATLSLGSMHGERMVADLDKKELVIQKVKGSIKIDGSDID